MNGFSGLRAFSIRGEGFRRQMFWSEFWRSAMNPTTINLGFRVEDEAFKTLSPAYCACLGVYTGRSRRSNSRR